MSEGKKEILLGDCLELMKNIPNESIDAIITDPPYGTTACKWDTVIPFDLMWEQLNRIIKPNGAIVLFGSEPFSSALRMSNIKNYKYDWVWNKKLSGGFAVAKYRPLSISENISVFGKGGIKYNPQMVKGKMRLKGTTKKDGSDVSENWKGLKSGHNTINDLYFPKTILEISNANRRGKNHPTQKPIELMEYLIKTYTNENETILDFTAGSFTTSIACLNTKRNYICMEKEQKYFDIGMKRIEDWHNENNSKLNNK